MDQTFWNTGPPLDAKYVPAGEYIQSHKEETTS